MRNRNIPRARLKSPAFREKAPLPWSYLIVVAACGCLLATGFFLAARQHFISMEFGIKNSRLRKQLEDLESEKRRLILAREVSLAPFEIKRTARNLGFREIVKMPFQNVVTATKAKAGALKSVAEIPAAISGKLPSVGTSSVQKPTRAHYAEPVKKPAAAAKQAKKPDGSKNKKERIEITAIATLR